MYDALSEYRHTLAMARSLIDLESRTFRDPPRQADRGTVEALRGGVAVLLVAGFEGYLKDLFSEAADDIQRRTTRAQREHLPEKMRVRNVFGALEISMSKVSESYRGTKSERLEGVIDSCNLVATQGISPEAFSRTNSNPKAHVVKDLFKGLCVDDVFKDVKPRFEGKSYWGQVVSDSFLNDKLNEIVERRNGIAHRGRADRVSRQDLRESAKFMRAFSAVLEMRCRRAVRDLVADAKKR